MKNQMWTIGSINGGEIKSFNVLYKREFEYINGYLKLYMHAYFIKQSDTVQQYVVRISTRNALSILLVIRGLFITFSLHIS